MRGRAEVARQAHNLEAVGSIPTPATKDLTGLARRKSFFYLVFEKLYQLLALVFLTSPLFPVIVICCHFTPFPKQNGSKIYGLEKKNQVCHETDELPLLYPAISIRAIASIPWTIRSAMYRTSVDAMLPWQTWVASPETQEHRLLYLHCRYRQGSMIESGSEIPNGSATVW